MIIQSARLRAGCDIAALGRHVFAGAANDDIVPLHGDRDGLVAMRDDAAAAGKPYAIRHYKISPAEPMTRVQAAELIRDIASEFGFDVRHCVIVEHAKPRAGDAGYDRHWHLLAPEWDPVRRRVLDAHWMRPRQEKLARRAELRLGHALVAGRWTAAVARAMAKDRQEGIDQVAALAGLPRPGSAYTGRRHQRAARAGIALPEAKRLVAQAWEGSDTAPAFAAALADLGLTVRAGDKKGTWLVETAAGADCKAPVLLGALHRLLRQPKRVVEARMAAPVPAPVRQPVDPMPVEAVAMTSTKPSPPPVVDRHVTVRCGDGSEAARARRRRWVARCLRGAYHLDWVPEALVARIARVEWHAATRTVILTLDTGTRLLDRGNRIDVIGRADDVAIAELVACAQRKGWTAVRITGSEAFRRAAAQAFRDAGIAVAGMDARPSVPEAPREQPSPGRSP